MAGYIRSRLALMTAVTCQSKSRQRCKQNKQNHSNYSIAEVKHLRKTTLHEKTTRTSKTQATTSHDLPFKFCGPRKCDKTHKTSEEGRPKTHKQEHRKQRTELPYRGTNETSTKTQRQETRTQTNEHKDTHRTHENTTQNYESNDDKH